MLIFPFTILETQKSTSLDLLEAKSLIFIKLSSFLLSIRPFDFEDINKTTLALETRKLV